MTTHAHTQATPPAPTPVAKIDPFPEKRVRPWDAIFHALVFGSVAVAIAALIWLMWSIVVKGAPHLTWDFLTTKATGSASTSGFTSAIRGSLVLMFVTMLVALPLGFAAAIYLEKFAAERVLAAKAREIQLRGQMASGNRSFSVRRKLLWARIVGPLNRTLEINISNLAAVPSIIYGLLGLALFISFAGLRESLFVGGLTLAMLVLPIVIISSREALRAVPISIEQGALGLGATKWQAVRGQIVPAAAPGMLTGSILAMSRAIGESAPLIVVGGVVFSTRIPSINPLNAESEALIAMPLQAFFWASHPRENFRELAAAGIIVLMVVLLVMNAAAIYLRNRYSKRW